MDKNTIQMNMKSLQNTIDYLEGIVESYKEFGSDPLFNFLNDAQYMSTQNKLVKSRKDYGRFERLLQEFTESEPTS
jgi:hypothetical protein